MTDSSRYRTYAFLEMPPGLSGAPVWTVVEVLDGGNAVRSLTVEETKAEQDMIGDIIKNRLEIPAEGIIRAFGEIPLWQNPDYGDESNLHLVCVKCLQPLAALGQACPRCGASIKSDAKSAGNVADPKGQAVCPKCHKAFAPGSKFCGFCGTPLPAAPPQARPASAPVERQVLPQGRTVSPPLVADLGSPSVPRMAAAPGTPPVERPDFISLIGVSQPVAVPPLPARSSAPTDGTLVFTGLHATKIEAKITEKKADGTVGRTVEVTSETTLGRENCDLNYPHDMLLSSQHAALIVREGKLLLRDLGSPNGSFIRQREDSELFSGDVFVLGRNVFRFTTESPDVTLLSNTILSGSSQSPDGAVTATLMHAKLNGERIAEFKLAKPEITLGRTTGDLIFQDDRYMSGTHARIVAQTGRFLLQDLHSRNGVYRRVRGEVELKDGDEFFMGEQLFRAEVKTLE
jgi:pSer/pThr/pTyr-binding forkhead associated (FHA) protein